MAVTPRLGVLMMATNMAQKETVFNEAVLAFDALFSGSVISAALTTPPGSPSDGDCYIVPTGATGAWAGMTNKIAFAYNGWQFVTPPDHYRVFNQATSAFLLYTTSAGWNPVAAGTPTNLDDLADVNAPTPTDGQVLKYDSGTHKWVAYTLPTTSPTTTLHALTDVNVSEGPGIDGMFLKWDNGTSKWIATTVPAPSTALSALTDVSVTEGAGIDGFLLSWKQADGKWEPKDPSSLAVVAHLSNVGDVTYGGGSPAVNDALVWNGAAWAPSSSAIHFRFEQMTDGPGTLVGAAGKVLIVDALETGLQYADLATFIAAAGIRLADLTDVAVTDGAGDDGKFLKWNNTTGKWVPSTVASPLAVADAGGVVDSATSQLKFTGTGVTVTDESAGHVKVDIAIPTQLNFQDHGVDVTAPSKLNFAGLCTVAEAGGILTLTVNGVSTLAALTDAAITSPATGDVLTYDAGAGKWKNVTLAAAVALLPNTLTAPTYEHGPFAPPTLAMFGTLVSATGITNQVYTGRGYLSVPGSYGAINYPFVGRTVSANTPPWQMSARVAVNSGVFVYYGGIAMRRSATNSLAFVGISNNGDGSDNSIVTFQYWNGTTETNVAWIKSDAQFVRLGFDGTNIKAYYSTDGLLWELLGSVNAATALSGTPDQCGLAHRVTSGVASNVSALYTYYDDPDYPAGARTSSAYGTLGLSNLTDVDSTAPTDGQYLQWQATPGKWVPANPPYKVGAFFTTGPATNEVLLIHVAATAFTLKANLAGSVGYVGTNPSSSFVLTVAKNGSAVGTITISTGGAFTFATSGGSAVSISAGDVVTITAPASVDATIANVALTLLGS